MGGFGQTNYGLLLRWHIRRCHHQRVQVEIAMLNVPAKEVLIARITGVLVRAAAVGEEVEDAAAEREDVDLARRLPATVHLGWVEPERADLMAGVALVRGGGGE
jgi:hypothetical protein